MKIDLTQTMNTLAGKPYMADGKPLTLGMVLAEILATDGTGGKMKLFSLAQRAYKDKSMDVDQADFNLIKGAAEKTNAYQGNAIILGQALEMLEKTK